MSIIGNDGASMLELPFKPFTLDEVKAITGVRGDVLDWWTNAVLQPKSGCGVVGLDWSQTFAVFVGWRFLEEGAEMPRADGVVKFLARQSPQAIDATIEAGRSMPTSKGFAGTPNSPLGRRLNVKQLLLEFKAGIARVFPNG